MEAYETAEQETAGYQASVSPREAAAKQQLIALSAEGRSQVMFTIFSQA